MSKRSDVDTVEYANVKRSVIGILAHSYLGSKFRQLFPISQTHD